MSKNVKKCQKMSKFHDHIWQHHEICIQQSTNMPVIGSLIREIDTNISEICERKHSVKLIPAFKVLKITSM